MTDADMAKLQTFVVDASGRDDWKAEPEFWLPVKALLARHRLTLDGAKDATLAAWKRFGNSPSQLYRGLATVLDESKQVNLPAANDAAPCGLCGFQGLVVIERRDGRRIEVRIGAECCDVGYITVVCTCPHGARLQAAWGDKLPWRLLANADRRRWQPLGGWPGDEAPKLSVVGSLEEEEIAF